MVLTDIEFKNGLNRVMYNDKNGQEVVIDENKPLYLKIGTLKQIKSVSNGDRIVSFPEEKILGTVDGLKNKIKIDNDAESEYHFTTNTNVRGGKRKSRRNQNSKKTRNNRRKSNRRR